MISQINTIVETLRENAHTSFIQITLSDEEVKAFLENPDLHVQKLAGMHVYRISLYMINVTLIA